VANFNHVVLAGTLSDLVTERNGYISSFDLSIRKQNKPTVYVACTWWGEISPEMVGMDFLVHGELVNAAGSVAVAVTDMEVV